MEQDRKEFYLNKVDEKSGLGQFLWNSRTKEFCGRTASSWGKCFLISNSNP